VNQFLNLVISGLVTGAIYSIMASGIVLTYQTSGIFNFSHGAVAFTCAYFYYQLHVGQDMPIVPALIISVFIFAPLLGLLLDRVLLRSLAKAPIYARIIGTIGLLVALPAIAQWLVEAVGNGVFGTDLPLVSQIASSGGTVPGIGPTPPHVFRLGWAGLPNVNLNSDQLAVFVVAALAALLLWFVIRKTRAGLEMRASVDRETLARLRGVSTARASAVAWVMTMLLAGLGGVLIGPLFPLNDGIFTLVVFGSLAAVALSGLRSIPIAFAGGLALGVIQNLVAGYGDDFLPGFLKNLDGFRAAVPFILTILILFIVGRDRSRAGGTIADERPPVDHRVGLPAWRRRVPWVVATLALVAFTMQWIDVPALQADAYEQGIITKGLVFAVIFLSFVVVTGLGGMVSLSQATFVIAGGFAAGWAINRDWGVDIPLIASHGQLNWLWAALIAALCAAGVGALVALPVRRLGAVALALGTFAVAFTADLVVFQQESISHGSNGWILRAPTLDLPLLPHYDFSQSEQRFVLFLIIFGLGTVMIHALMRSPSGRQMLAVRSSDVAARASGIQPARPQVLIFALSAGIAGLGGALLAMNDGGITSLSAPPVIGLVWIAVAVTFGVRRPGGALLAGLAFGGGSQLVFNWIGNDFLTGGLHDLVTSPYFATMLFGLGAINLAQNPDGILAIIGHQKLERRLARERKEHFLETEAALHGDDAAAAAARAGDLTTAEAAVRADEAASSFAREVGLTRVDGIAPPVVGDGAALWLDGIVAAYGDVEVVHGASLAVRPGEVLALLGANGAGKSTLCSVTAGLVEPTAGRVVVDGDDVTATSAVERSRAGLLLIPEGRGIFPGLTVEENLKILLREPDERRRACERFPVLDERRNQVAGLLSGGEQQMLSLAPALAQPPRLFIADEPTLGLSPLASEIVLEAIRELRDRGSAVVLVAERANEVMDLADVLVFMELGRVVWAGAREQANAEQLAAAYLGIRSPTAEG
jgi:ABC-type branched-subunit amino acid transport system ATPase component/branched-subunit amino acid ABC-type transport system permease component